MQFGEIVDDPSGSFVMSLFLIVQKLACSDHVSRALSQHLCTWLCFISPAVWQIPNKSGPLLQTQREFPYRTPPAPGAVFSSNWKHTCVCVSLSLCVSFHATAQAVVVNGHELLKLWGKTLRVYIVVHENKGRHFQWCVHVCLADAAS